MSARLSNMTVGSYGAYELWLDHVAINHSIHFVKSSGNTGEGVTSPGMAYNIITVGSINDNNSNIQENHTIATSSSYQENAQLTNKPDLMAPGVSIATSAGTNSGTSFAAPHVTAVVAQLCQRRPILKVQQDAVKAILTASIPHKKHRYVPTDSNYDQYGAGVVDAKSAYYVTDNYRFRIGTFEANETSGATKTYTFEVFPSDETIRISLSWLKYAYISENHVDDDPNYNATLADLDLYVYDPDGEPRGTSAQYHNNTEIIEIPEVEPGIYTIVIEQYVPSDRAVYFAVAWW